MSVVLPEKGVPIGINNLHYAILESDTSTGVSYSTPVPIPGVRTIRIRPNTRTDTLFADNAPMEVATTLGAIEVEIEVANIPQQDQAALLGHTIDTNGVMIRKSTDIPPWVAIGFTATKSNGHTRYVWLLKGKFGVPEQEYETKGEEVRFKPTTITGNFVHRDYDKAWIKQVDSDAPNYSATVGSSWFTSVEPTV